MKFDRWDTTGAAGLLLVTAGAGLAWWPLLLLVPGAALLFVAWRGSSRV